MATGARLAVLDYVRLGELLLDKWGDLARTIATQVDSETLTADKVTTNASECALLAAESLALMVNAAFDAAAGFAGGRSRLQPVHSQTFSTSDSARVRALRLAGPLVADLGNDALPVSVVTIVPAVLEAGDTDFHLEADTTGHQALGYSGTVQVLDDTGAVVEPVPVWLTA
jgi:hypothetical protein